MLFYRHSCVSFLSFSLEGYSFHSAVSRVTYIIPGPVAQSVASLSR